MAVIAIAREKQITVSAASLAFYAFNSLVALAVLVYATFSSVGTGNLLATILQVLTGVGSGEVQQFFERLGSNTSGQHRAVVIASVITVWSSLRLFRAVESVFMNVYERRAERSVRQHLVNSTLVLGVVTTAIILLASLGSLFLFRGTGLLWDTLGPVVLWLSLVVLFVPMYYKFSGSDISVGEILPGTVFAATVWTIATVSLRLYITTASSVDLFGVVGAVLLVLTWLYVVAFSLLLGVVLNAFLADRIEPTTDWYVFER